MAKQEIRKPVKDVTPFIGKYERKDGTRFDVIYAQKEGLQSANESNGLKNRLFSPITVDELEKELKDKLITKI